MRKIIKISIITLFLNFFMLSFGYGQQSGVNVMGVVPETDLNRNSGKIKVSSQDNGQPIFKENKYIYFFEKAFSLSANSDAGQTKYDAVASKLILWLFLILCAIILWLVLKFLDQTFFPKIFKHKKHYKFAR